MLGNGFRDNAAEDGTREYDGVEKTMHIHSSLKEERSRWMCD
jgi:hypothetical protein